MAFQRISLLTGYKAARVIGCAPPHETADSQISGSKQAAYIFPQLVNPQKLPCGTEVDFLLAFDETSCHKRDTARREARRLQVQEGHSIGSFGVWKAQPQSRKHHELPRRANQGRVGGFRRFWIGVGPSLRILRSKGDRNGSVRVFPNVLTMKKERS
jgi:hypothetical protein